MTSLRQLTFADIHSRHSQPCSLENSINFTESLTLAHENLFYIPNDIIENYGYKIHSLDLSHNKFCR